LYSEIDKTLTLQLPVVFKRREKKEGFHPLSFFVENWYRFITIHPSFSFLLPLVKGEGREGVSILFREGLGEVERRQYKFKIKNNRR
jgi:hypothetical protein